MKSLIFLLIVGLAACSADISIEKPPELNAKKFYHKIITPEFGEVHCWVNLMPNSESLVHLSGQVELNQSDDYNYQNLELSQVRIYQSDSLYYFVSLQVMENKITADSTSRSLIFNTYNGLKLKEGFKTGKSVLLDFIFSEGKSLYSAVVRDVYLEKVY